MKKVYIFTHRPAFLLFFLIDFVSSGNVVSTAQFHTCTWSGAIGDSIDCIGSSLTKGKDSERPKPMILYDLQSGVQHTCALFLGLDSEKKISCWGLNEFLQAQDPPHIEGGVPLKIAVSNWYNCALYEVPESRVRLQCWGRKSLALPPVPLDLDQDSILDIYTGERFICVSTTNTEDPLKCWGDVAMSELVDSNVDRVFGRLQCVLDNSNRKATCKIQDKVSAVYQEWYNQGARVTTEYGKITSLNFSEGQCEDCHDLVGQQFLNFDFSESHLCIVSVDGLVCRGNNYDGQCSVGELINMGPILGRISHIPAFLERLKPHVYSFDQQFLDGLIKLIEKYSGSEIEIIEPVILTLHNYLSEIGYVRIRERYLNAALLRIEGFIDQLGLRKRAENTESIWREGALRVCRVLIESAKMVSTLDGREQIDSVLAEISRHILGQKHGEINGLHDLATEFLENPYLTSRGIALLEWDSVFRNP